MNPRRAQGLKHAYLGGALLSLQPLLLSAIALPATAYVIRTLGPTQYGQWVMALTLVMLTMLLCNLGLRGTFVRAVVRQPEAASRLLAEQLGLRLALCVPAGLIALAACAALGYSRIVLLCTAVAVVWMALTTVATTAADLLQAHHRLAAVAGVNTIAGLSLTALSVFAAHAGSGPVGVAASYMIGAAAAGMLMLRVVKRQGVALGISWNLRRAAQLLWEGRFFGIQLLVNNAAHQVENILVPRLMGPTTFGYFAAGALLSDRMLAIPDGAAKAAYAAIADIDHVSRAAARRVFVRFLVASLLACLAATMAVSILVDPIAQLLFPKHPEVCAQVMRITIWALPIAAVQYVFSSTLNALGREAFQARASLVGSVCALLLAGLLVWKYGIVGASWSVVIREALWLVLLAPGVMTLFRTPTDRNDVPPRAVAAGQERDPALTP